jgi:hypothetical protein
VVNLAVMVATLTNDIGPVTKPISEFVEGMLGAEGRKQFTSLAEVASTAEALDRELFPPARVATPGDSRGGSKRDGLLRVIVMASVGIAVVAFVTWLWSHSHTPR